MRRCAHKQVGVKITPKIVKSALFADLGQVVASCFRLFVGFSSLLYSKKLP